MYVGRELDASLEAALVAHQELMKTEEKNGEGKECYITEGFHRGAKASKLELGTWVTRLHLQKKRCNASGTPV